MAPKAEDVLQPVHWLPSTSWEAKLWREPGFCLAILGSKIQSNGSPIPPPYQASLIISCN